MKINISNWLAIIVGVALGLVGCWYLTIFIIVSGMK